MKTITNATDQNSEFTTTYSVPGMTCGHCVASVTEEISELNAVTGVEVDLHSGGASAVTVRSSTALNREDVVTAIREAGYELVTD